MAFGILDLVPVFHGVKPPFPPRKCCYLIEQMKKFVALSISLLHT